MSNSLYQRNILLIISGGIAAYKSLELIRRLRDYGATVRCVLTQGGAQFVTPLSVSALSEQPVYTDLWQLADAQQSPQTSMNHIRLSREADLIVIAPASANLMAKMAQGLADDLASTLLLAADKPILLAPAMNVQMWQHPATQANVETLRTRGCHFVGPAAGDMACGEVGAGRMSEPEEILTAITNFFVQPLALNGKRALVTAGPTLEALDPVRFLGNRSSGKQGYAVAEALARLGAETVLVTGPTNLPAPPGIKVVQVETAVQMLAACEAELPVDIAVCAAAVVDWRPAEQAPGKLKKGSASASIALVENPDILARLSQPSNSRPQLVVGFAAETQDLLPQATAKLQRKGCDWLVANQVGANLVFDADDNEVIILRQNATKATSHQNWPRQSKQQVAKQLADAIADFFNAA